MSIKCIIVDDEPRAHVILTKYISELDNIVLAGAFRNAFSAYEFIKANPVDLLLLDIEMPKINGFSLLKMLDPKPMVIITTGFTNYALESYEYSAIDYLQKPIRFERFVSAVEKAVKWKQVGEEIKGLRYLETKYKNQRHKVNPDDIIYIECLGNYAKMTLRDGTVSQKLITITELTELLPDKNFLRIHRSFIINTAFITGVQDDQIIIGDISIPIGKTYKRYVQLQLKKWFQD